MARANEQRFGELLCELKQEQQLRIKAEAEVSGLRAKLGEAERRAYDNDVAFRQWQHRFDKLLEALTRK